MVKKNKKLAQKSSRFKSTSQGKKRQVKKKELIENENNTGVKRIQHEELSKERQIEEFLKTELSGVTQAEIALLQALDLEMIKRVISNSKELYKTQDKFAFKKFVLHFLIMEAEEQKKWKSLKQEVSAIKELGANTASQQARLLIYEALLALEAGRAEETELTKIRQAGQILYNAEGMKGMYDRLLWNFVPKKYERLIDINWDGIGEWLG